jgi:hypothetical protein
MLSLCPAPVKKKCRGVFFFHEKDQRDRPWARTVAARRLNPNFPDDSLISAWRLRLFLGKPSVSDDFLPK